MDAWGNVMLAWIHCGGKAVVASSLPGKEPTGSRQGVCVKVVDLE